MQPSQSQPQLKPQLQPTVSLCTPTFNRRPFIGELMQCIIRQTYPADRIEWIVVDDGTDSVADLFEPSALPLDLKVNVKYTRLAEKMPLGKKRNLTHSLCSGDILIYIDDDDYYPPTRISHAVSALLMNPHRLVAGCSTLYMYYSKDNCIYQYGPYGANHATAATFAFRRQLLQHTSFDETSLISEEKTFLKGYSIPMIQLDPVQTILVIYHKHFTIDREQSLAKPEQFNVIATNRTCDQFIPDAESRTFYCGTIHDLIRPYDFGTIDHKPAEKKLFREKMEQLQQQQQQQQQPNKNAVSTVAAPIINAVPDCQMCKLYLATLQAERAKNKGQGQGQGQGQSKDNTNNNKNKKKTNK
jgi:glycosyltransferase involved in cell wall biosynthesis